MESDPPGAQVYLKQAGRETLLGTTPFDYQAEFHSEQSILRFVFKKPGHKPVTLEVQVNQNPVYAKFEQAQFTASPAVHQDPRLKDLQQRINPLLDKEIPRLLGADPSFEAELLEPVRAADFGGETGLLIRLRAGKIQAPADQTGMSRRETTLRALWTRLGTALALPIAAQLREQQGIQHITLEVAFDEQRVQFGVDARIETTVEMQCVGGNEYWKESDFVCDYKGCGTRIVNKSRYNPCLHKIPVAKSEVKLDPKASSRRDLSTAYYFMPLSLVEKGGAQEPDKLYEKIGVLLTDASGARLKQQDPLPKFLLTPSR
jgi:hypothetical protein